jgi:hypothetical protein
MQMIPRLAGLCCGGDCNPEQWPERVWKRDHDVKVDLATATASPPPSGAGMKGSA